MLEINDQRLVTFKILNTRYKLLTCNSKKITELIERNIMTCNGGRGTVRVVMFTGSTITIDLCTNVFSSPASATFIDLLLFWW